MTHERRRPDWIGVGVQRSGTTFVQRCLEAHPEIGKPTNGLHFFSHDVEYNPEIESVAVDDLAWYEGQLARFAGCKSVGEFSVTYGFSENLERCAGRIREHYPDVKILIALRNPVNRVISEYGRMRQGLEVSKKTPIPEWIDAHPEIIDRGRYHKLLETYFGLFPREQIHVKVFEDMLEDRDAYVESLYAFLGVDTSFRPEQGNPNPSRPIRNEGIEKAIWWVQDVMRPLKEGPLSFVHRVLKATGLREAIRRVNVEEGKIEVGEDVRGKLRELYRDDVAKVEQILGRDLPSWR